MGGVLTDIKDWIFNTIKDIKNYFCELVGRYYKNIAKF